MTTEPMHQAFLQAILEAPDEDGPRLVYADWLEDNGDPDKAEFIRAQCEIARLEKADLIHEDRAWMDLPDPELDGLGRRAEELKARNEGCWAAGLEGITLTRNFRRGLLEFVRVSASRLAELAGGGVFRRAPVFE